MQFQEMNIETTKEQRRIGYEMKDFKQEIREH